MSHCLRYIAALFETADGQLIRAAFQKLLTRGVGIGLAIAGSDLSVVVVRVHSSGAAVLGTGVIHAFEKRAPREVGTEYERFLRRLGVAPLAAVVLLPPSEVVFRTIRLPGVPKRLVPSAIDLQLPDLVPWQEHSVHDWTQVGRTSSFLIAMTKRSTVDRYANLFEQARIRTSRFTFDCSVLYAGIHTFSAQTSPFLAVGEYRGGHIVYGESSSRPLFVADVDSSIEDAKRAGIAQLRLDPATDAVPLTKLLPTPTRQPADFSLSHSLMVYLTAVHATKPWFIRSANLLPKKGRRSNLRAAYLPTAILAAHLAFAWIFAWIFPTIRAYRDRRAIEVEIQRIEPQWRSSDALDHRIASTHLRAETIDEFRRRTKYDMDALDDLTRLIQPPVWARSITLTRHSLSLTGEADRAEGLLRVIDGSAQFRSSEFSVPVTRLGKSEAFSIRATRRKIGP